MWGAWLLEEFVQQHENLAALNEGSLNSLRVITTWHRRQSPRIDYCILKVGAGGRLVDNAHGAGLYLRVDTETGKLADVAFDESLTRHYRHPVTGVTFAIEEVVDCIYTRCNLFVPNMKWKLAHLLAGSLITGSQAAMLHEALRYDPLSMADLDRRIEVLEALCNSIDKMFVSGAGALSNRRAFQACIQLRDETLADVIASHVEPPIAAAVRDIVNYSLCTSAAELREALLRNCLLEPWQTLIPRITGQLKEGIDGVPRHGD
jgi:hypothetical protein